MAMPRVQIRALVILGFSLNAVGGVASYLDSVTSGGYEFNSFRVIVDPLFPPLAAVATVVAWYLLTQLEARDESGLKILRRAYLFFAIEYILFAASFNFIFTPIHYFGAFWVTAALWLDFIGALVAALGLFLTSRSLVASVDVDQPMAEVGGTN
jgi:hypothetical protein